MLKSTLKRNTKSNKQIHVNNKIYSKTSIKRNGTLKLLILLFGKLK